EPGLHAVHLHRADAAEAGAEDVDRAARGSVGGGERRDRRFDQEHGWTDDGDAAAGDGDPAAQRVRRDVGRETLAVDVEHAGGGNAAELDHAYAGEAGAADRDARVGRSAAGGDGGDLRQDPECARAV